MTHGSSLHDCADDSKDSCDNQVPATADLVSNPTSTKSTDETTALQSGDNIGLEIGERNRVEAGKAISTNGCVSSESKVRVCCTKSYSLKVDIVKTPPMIPESIPKSIPPKQAYFC